MESSNTSIKTHSQANDSFGCEPNNKPRVLIVDDEMMNLKLFKAYLKKEDYEISTAENGHDAIDMANKNLPDVILLDVMIPGIDGFGVARHLKNASETSNIPIILVTALSGRENRARGLDSGADEFLTKPVKQAELVARVRSMIRLRRFQDQLQGRKTSMVTGDEGENQAYRDQRIPTVLIVEDNLKQASLLEQQLKSEAYVVRHVTNGEIAIQKALDMPVDLVILDVLLPGISGFEVCHIFKNDDRLKDIQVVLHTSLRDLESRVQGASIGADDYLIKPVDIRELKARTKTLLKKKAYIDQLQNKYELAMNQAICDGLTGLYNHNHFSGFLDLEIKRSARHNHFISLFIMDLDNFKSINDTYGHLAGDHVLVQVSNLLKESIREIDFAARYGGEEFAVVMPYTDAEEARIIAERVRATIFEKVKLPKSPRSSLVVSGSIGVSMFPIDGNDKSSLIRKADEMMYLAKQSGKNKVCVSSDFRFSSGSCFR